MTSRRLWLLLTVLATPLILYGTTGCQLVFSLDRPDPITNAYTCGCACNPGPRDVTSPIAADNDDAEERRSSGAILRGSSDLGMTSEFLVGLRFTTLGIPQGAVISSAYVQFTAAQTDPNPAMVAIRIEDADDAAPFVGTTFNLSLRPQVVVPQVDWTSGAWTSNDQGPAQQTADLTTLIQSVVSRPAWTDASSLVLILDATTGSRIAASADAAGDRQPVLHVTYVDAAATVTANIPVCLNEVDNQSLTPGAANADSDGNGDGVPDVLANDCANRVENSYRGLIGACGYVPNPAANCNCEIVPTGFHDKNENGVSDSGEDYFGFTREICNEGPPVCAEVPVNTDPADLCSNFDPQAFGACVEENLAACGENSIPPEVCNLDDCLPFVTATNAAGGDPLCIAHASEAPAPLAFHLFGQRSTCEVVGLSDIEVGEDGREPKKSPLTRGTLEILGRPCPGRNCAVGISTQLAMNPITFDVRWASDPTFSNLIEAGNSTISAGSLSALGVGTLAAGSTANVGRGQRGSDRAAFLGTNDSPLNLTVNWADHACSLDGNLTGAVDAESVEGTCQGDGAVACFNDSPDCDGVGGPCNLPDDPQPMVVDVSLAGRLINQPPTADAGLDQTVECTSPAGATFQLDGSQSFDPDGPDMRVFSWREGSRVGPEFAFDRLLRPRRSLGVGEDETYVLRVIDSFAQADEDTVAAEVVDTTPPDVFCNTASGIVPPNKPASFTATATDICTAGTIVPELIAYRCFKINGSGALVDNTATCKVRLGGPTVIIKNTGGVGQHIAWTARAIDGSGNVRDVSCEIVSANPGNI